MERWFKMGYYYLKHLIFTLVTAQRLYIWALKPNLLSIIDLNPFQANVLLLYLLKSSENICFSDVIKRWRKGKLFCNGLKTPSFGYLDLFIWNLIDRQYDKPAKLRKLVKIKLWKCNRLTFPCIMLKIGQTF